ncbi:hypothetical protein EJF18_10956 [Clavispora lusitaniae]|uniref:Mitochondrial outer membrane protein OM14 C-terminal domain-containing protein n=3 Tax=Clavispora lusitaniae TaxID=36911 RepID=C4XYA2_CLAL4|nr:uncharacterized protein CLUG_00925 [Clavispora lusitaniae ATCC 42720]KAF5212745.1 hypothetical protein E0198_000245 [Clavispora lusitaniae]EEQ36802.1 hypothetical protein CLUG_00925 [Clavispora lusitaniae ATCC 42720]KAF7584804.1 putative integral membrane protein [Clavispora lusitaniae]OVF08059.1 hypothetical protein A9F13_10g02134 [Clavispora lusitaniae]QFZ25838.1 hypothetical protein EJF14_10956 [Clavispora lusitaniae]
MSTYAEAAASSGPTGAQKLPEPAKVQHTTEPHGGVELVDKEELEEIKKDAKERARDAVAKGKKTLGDVAEVSREDAKRLKEEGKSLWSQAVAYASEKYDAVSSYVRRNVNSDTVAAAGRELQNPAVVGQLALIAGAATAGSYVYSERARIRSDNGYVVAIHAGLITALVLGDVYVFRRLYARSKRA